MRIPRIGHFFIVISEGAGIAESEDISQDRRMEEATDCFPLSLGLCDDCLGG